jgi:hypothetical protein
MSGPFVEDPRFDTRRREMVKLFGMVPRLSLDQIDDAVHSANVHTATFVAAKHLYELMNDPGSWDQAVHAEQERWLAWIEECLGVFRAAMAAQMLRQDRDQDQDQLGAPE